MKNYGKTKSYSIVLTKMVVEPLMQRSSPCSLGSALGLSLLSRWAQELIDEIDLDGDGSLLTSLIFTLMMDLRKVALTETRKPSLHS